MRVFCLGYAVKTVRVGFRMRQGLSFPCCRTRKVLNRSSRLP